MSNRIAAPAADRIAWSVLTPPRGSQWRAGWPDRLRGWRAAAAGRGLEALSPRLRRDLGLPELASTELASTELALGLPASRLGV